MRKFLEIPRNFFKVRCPFTLDMAGAFGSNTFRGRANTLRGWSKRPYCAARPFGAAGRFLGWEI